MTDKTITLGLEIKNEKIKEELKAIISSVNRFLVQNSNKAENSDLMILEIGDDLNKDFQRIQTLQDAMPSRELFLTSKRVEPEVLIKAMRSGAKEFFPQPLKAKDVTDALTKFLERRETAARIPVRRKPGKIINVIGSKGGVGTTTVAVNIAASLKQDRHAKSVALVDMNLLFGEIPLFLDIKPAFNWAEIVQNISRLDSTYLMSVLSRHSSGICVLPSPTGLDGGGAAPPDIIVELLRFMQSEFDYIVIDSGQSIDEVSLKILEISDSVLLVSILSLPCLINVKRLLDTFWSLGYPQKERVKIIVNRYDKKSVITLKEAEKGIQEKVSWVIPNDYQTTMSAINQGKMLFEMAGKEEITENFKKLSELVPEISDKAKEWSPLKTDEKKWFRR